MPQQQRTNYQDVLVTKNVSQDNRFAIPDFNLKASRIWNTRCDRHIFICYETECETKATVIKILSNSQALCSTELTTSLAAIGKRVDVFTKHNKNHRGEMGHPWPIIKIHRLHQAADPSCSIEGLMVYSQSPTWIMTVYLLNLAFSTMQYQLTNFLN